MGRVSRDEGKGGADGDSCVQDSDPLQTRVTQGEQKRELGGVANRAGLKPPALGCAVLLEGFRLPASMGWRCVWARTTDTALGSSDTPPLLLILDSKS